MNTPFFSIDPLLQSIIVGLDVADEMQEVQFQSIVDRASQNSMVHASGLAFTVAATLYSVKHNFAGPMVECGSWKGGCAWAILETQRRLLGLVRNQVICIDSFKGLPSVTPIDGPLATSWQADSSGATFFENCSASKGELYAFFESTGFVEGTDYQIIEGWFDEVVPVYSESLGDSQVALLRLDADWYESTKICLGNLGHRVVEEGIVIIDDYYAWDGCAQALHEYLSETKLPYRIKSLPHNFGAYLVKRRYRTSFEVF